VNPGQTAPRIQGCNNIVIITPTRPRRSGGVTQGYGDTILDCDLLELAIGKESDPPAIRRKERHIRSFGTEERRKLALLEQARGQAKGSGRGLLNDCDPRAVR
jgi:hypothetical protein